MLCIKYSMCLFCFPRRERLHSWGQETKLQFFISASTATVARGATQTHTHTEELLRPCRRRADQTIVPLTNLQILLQVIGKYISFSAVHFHLTWHLDTFFGRSSSEHNRLSISRQSTVYGNYYFLDYRSIHVKCVKCWNMGKDRRALSDVLKLAGHIPEIYNFKSRLA